jgi:L-ascorbate metabolism protein UlaG (beta-lactamase superfamily)
MDAEQGIECLRIIQPDMAIPIHYNDYDVFKDPLENFVRAVERAGVQDKVRYLYHGESYAFVPRTSAIESAA